MVSLPVPGRGDGYFIALSHTSETVGGRRVLGALLLFVGLCTYSYLAKDRLIDHIHGVTALVPSLLLYLFTVFPAFVAVHYLLESDK